MRVAGGGLALTVLVAAGLAADGPVPRPAPSPTAAADRDVREATGTPAWERTDPGPGGQPAFDERAVTAQGRWVYQEFCARCHGESGEGRSGCCCRRGPPLAGSELTRWQIRAATRHGMPGMPAFGGRLSEAEIKAVAAYVQALGAGRPAE